MRCAGLKPDCALNADEANDIQPFNGMGEINSTSQLVPEDLLITAAVDSISIAVSGNIDGKQTVLTFNEDLADY